jgi:hypothetical protein
MVLGIDPVIPLTDFAKLTPEQGIEVIEWAARTLVRSVVESVAVGTEARGARARQATSHAAASPNVQVAPRRRQRVGQTKGA